MKIKTNELIDLALDWAVAKCEGRADPIYRYGDDPQDFYISGPQRQGPFKPSTDWSQGGPIIEREGIDITMVQSNLRIWAAEIYETSRGYKRQQATRPLVAATRCYVASKLGDEVEIPAELLTE